MSHLATAGVPSVVYYPRPLHQQTAYSRFPTDPEGLAVSERLAQTVFSLPMHPYLTESDQDIVIAAVQEASGAN